MEGGEVFSVKVMSRDGKGLNYKGLFLLEAVVLEQSPVINLE